MTNSKYWMIYGTWPDGGVWLYGQPHTGLPFPTEEAAQKEAAQLRGLVGRMNFAVCGVDMRDPNYKDRG